MGVSDPLRSGFIQDQSDCFGFGSKSIFSYINRDYIVFITIRFGPLLIFFKFNTSIQKWDHTAILSFSDKFEILEASF